MKEGKKIEGSGLGINGKPIREIIIRTDGDIIDLVKAECSGIIELIAILNDVINYTKQNAAEMSKTSLNIVDNVKEEKKDEKNI